MKFRKSSLTAIVGCMVFVSSASAGGVNWVENICEVKPDGSIHTVRLSSLTGGMYFKYYFKNVALQHTFVFTDPAPAHGPRTFALNPGTYTFKFAEVAGNLPQVTWPHTIVLRPYTLRPGQGTGCILNVPVTGVGRKSERVPTTPLPQ